MSNKKLKLIRPSWLDPKGEQGKLKTPLQLIPPVSSEQQALAMKLGAEKYGPWNWRQGSIETMTYVGAIKRHLDLFIEGEDNDSEGYNASHLGHIMAGCAILLDAQKHGTLVDDRPPRPNPSNSDE